MIIVSNSNIPLWVREKVVVSVEHFVVAMGHTFLLVLTRPSAHNKNFPYHVRTTQIGIMQVRALLRRKIKSLCQGPSPYMVSNDPLK